MSDIFDDIKNWDFFGKRKSRVLIIENPKERKKSLDQKILRDKDRKNFSK